MNYKDDERQLLSKAKEKENKAIQVRVIPAMLNAAILLFCDYFSNDTTITLISNDTDYLKQTLLSFDNNSKPFHCSLKDRRR